MEQTKSKLWSSNGKSLAEALAKITFSFFPSNSSAAKMALLGSTPTKKPAFELRYIKNLPLQQHTSNTFKFVLIITCVTVSRYSSHRLITPDPPHPYKACHSSPK